jgi:hypothetical protein
MRLLAAGLLVGAILADSSIAQSSFDAVLNPGVKVESLVGRTSCALWTAAEQLARHAAVPIAFEQTAECHPASWTRRADGSSQLLVGMTVREAFDQLASQADYRWEERDGRAIMRPVVAWQSGGSVLDRRVSPFTLTEQSVHEALHVVFEAADPPLFQEHTHLASPTFARPVTVRFDGGTLLEALNAVAASAAGNWQAGYTRAERGHRLDVVFYTSDYGGGSTQMVSRVITVPHVK